MFGGTFLARLVLSSKAIIVLEYIALPSTDTSVKLRLCKNRQSLSSEKFQISLPCSVQSKCKSRCVLGLAYMQNLKTCIPQQEIPCQMLLCSFSPWLLKVVLQ